MNNTEEWWSILDDSGQEVSLHQFGWSVTTVGGSRYDLPPRRGSNMTLAYRPGQVHRSKLPDARQITLVMFMVGWDPATGANDTVIGDYQRTQWNDNWDTLRRLVYKNWGTDNRVRLTRRWRLTAPTFATSRSGNIAIVGDPGVPASGQDRIITAFTYAEMIGQMPPTMTGRYRSDFQLDFTLTDPYFYGGTVSTSMTDADDAWVWNDGHDIAAHAYVQIDLVGPLSWPRVLNLSTDPVSWVQYKGDIASGDTVRLVCSRFAAEKLDTPRNLNRVGLIANYGSRFWLPLLPGANKLKMDARSGSGHALVSFRPPYV
jgi:hypothetical protein